MERTSIICFLAFHKSKRNDSIVSGMTQFTDNCSQSTILLSLKTQKFKKENNFFIDLDVSPILGHLHRLVNNRHQPLIVVPVEVSHH